MHPGGGITIEGEMDASVVRYTQEIAEFAEKLKEIDERTREAPLEVVERELERLRASTESASARTPTVRARPAAREVLPHRACSSARAALCFRRRRSPSP